MATVIVKENESLTVLRQVSSRRSARESITRSQASDVRRSLKQLESVSTTKSLFSPHTVKGITEGASSEVPFFVFFCRYTVDISLHSGKLKIS